MSLRRVLAASIATLAAAASIVATGTQPAGAAGSNPGQDKQKPFSFAVIGDVPYGPDQLAAFPGWIDQINSAQPRMTFHVGDIKSGSSLCEDSYYRLIRADFDRFKGPLIYTPGDNDWTDCHRVNNGAYNPLERLAFDRSVFFDHPGQSLGQRTIPVQSEAARGFPENVRLRRENVDFAMVHIVGSNDDLQPWTGIGNTVATPEQTAEEKARMINAIKVIRDAFDAARRSRDRAVVVMTQADMFDPTYTPAPTDISAFQPLVQTLVDQASTFRGEVYLVNGDSHVFNSDQPLATGSPWLATYGITGAANNLHRVTVDGSANNTDWLKVTITRGGTTPALAFERVPYTS